MTAYRRLRRSLPYLKIATIAALLGGLAGCGHVGSASSSRACLARAMYFESIRSSEEGMLAVGTVVMNRVESGKYGRSVCGVVGAKNQFAPGVLSRPMSDKRSRARAEKVAGQVLAGKRHRAVGKAMFFHTAGRTYRFENMHYVLVEGGNAFYERKPTGRRYIPRTMIAQAGPRDSISAPRWGFGNGIAAVGNIARPVEEPTPVVVAAAQPQPRRRPRATTPAAPATQSQDDIAAIILASNGF
jgi:spore germination cell wall hydrolase CwlJ-like protein